MNGLSSSLSFLNTLLPWQWALLAAVPPLIVLLYFLKLRRQPLEVPSTFLWSRTMEDLHVNSIWQRLRQNLLLFLQLLLIALVMLALSRPGWQGTELSGSRFIFLIDNSASMNATDIAPSRLEVAKKQVLDLVDQMKSGDVAMLISFSNVARIEQSYTDNRPALRQRIQQITPTNRGTNLVEALRAAAGLANPGRTSEVGTNDVQVADAMPATLYIFSDGGFSDVPDFSIGNLSPIYVPIGSEAPSNLGVTAFSTDRNSEKPGQIQAFGRLENSSPADIQAQASLYLNDRLLDATTVTVPARGGSGVQFELQDSDDGVLRLEVDYQDHLAIDNRAYAPLNPPRQANVLFITPSNPALEAVAKTDEALKVALVTFQPPSYLETPEYERDAELGTHDLIIYHQCVPKKLPQCNTLFLGSLPPGDQWKGGSRGEVLITDVDRQHPLTQFVELGDALFLEGLPVNPPDGGQTLIDMTTGPLLAIGPRQGFEDAVLGTELLPKNDKGQNEENTTWHLRSSFPVFFLNAFRYLGGNYSTYEAPSVKPGSSITLRSTIPVDRIRVELPSQRDLEVPRDTQNAFAFADTHEIGVYSVREGTADRVSQQFAVNLFDNRESDLDVREAISLGHNEIAGDNNVAVAREELWKWILFAGLCVLMFEWYVYNRRVYL